MVRRARLTTIVEGDRPMPQPARHHIARNRYRVIGVTAVGAAAALALSGCGDQVPALEDVWPEVSESIQKAESVTIDGNIAQGGQDMSVTMSGQIDDSSYAGSVAMGEAQVEVVGNTETTYMKPNAAFYEEMGGAQLQDLVGEKWLEVPAEEDGFTMSNFWSSFSEDIPEADEFTDAEYTKELAEHDGAEVYKYSGTSAENGEPVTLYIDRDHRLVRVEVQQGESTDDASASPSASPAEDTGTGTVDFSDWNTVDPVEMPDEAEVFALPGM